MINICELFPGVGGFRLGLERASDEFNFVWANGIKGFGDEFRCYINHFGKENYVDLHISEIDKNEIPKHDLLIGGFPCQDYSVSRIGTQEIEVKNSVLWWQIRDILESKQPKFVLLETSEILLKSPSSQRGRNFGVMLTCFNELGYSVEWRVINAAEYGFSQKRKRIFIFAFRNDTDYAGRINQNNLRDWIYNTGFFQEEFPIISYGDEIEEDNIDSEKISITENYDDIVDV